MDVYKACWFSTVGQAIYEDPYGTLHLATIEEGMSSPWFLKRKKRKNNKDWNNGNSPWKDTFRDRGGNRWKPVAPRKD